MSISFETVKEGDQLPPFSFTPDMAMVIKYAPFFGDMPAFFYDEAAALKAGMPGRMVPGPLKLGFLYRVVEDWLGDAGFVRHVRAAHRRPDTQGREITVTGQVARVYEEDGHRRADLEMVIVNQEGQPSVRGFASVEFTS
jgi:acyl dehydratase